MQKLFENFRKYVNEAQDPDTDADDGVELRNMAPKVNRPEVENLIADFSFNSARFSWNEFYMEI